MKTRPPLRLAADPAEADRPGIRDSVRIRTAARRLDMNERDVRKLLDDGDLEGHRIGKRGVRVYVDSIAEYQQRRPIANGAPAAAAPAAKRASHKAGYREALAFLAKHDIT